MTFRLNNDAIRFETIREALIDVDGTLYSLRDRGYLRACFKSTVGAIFDDAPLSALFRPALWSLAATVQRHGLHRGSALPAGSPETKRITGAARRGLTPDFVRRDPALIDAFSALRRDDPAFNLVVVTHSPKRWAKEVMDRLGIADLIAEDRLICADTQLKNLAFIDKGYPQSYGLLSKLGYLAPETDRVQAILIDDSLRNMQAAKSAGLITAWISAQDRTTLPDYIDMVAHHPAAILQRLGQRPV